MKSGLLALLFFSAATARSADSIELFNGKDLSGWTWICPDKNVKVDDVWSVHEGVLRCKGKPAGYLRTNDDYTSFMLSVEWRVIKPGNGGVLLRANGPEKVWPTSIEAQLNTNDAGDIWDIDDFPIKVDPARTEGRRTKKLHPTNEKPLGEWNEYEITLDGAHLTLKVNGELQNEATDCQIVAGKICLQSEGGELEYRKINITPITGKAATDKNEKAMQTLAIELFDSLNAEQRKAALLPFDSPDRKEERFTPGARAGVLIKDLADPQRELAMLMLKRFTSEYGFKKVQAILAQPGNAFEKNYLAFFGEPGPGKTYAWRIGEHHLTIVQVEVEKGEPTTFGPILLGADPPVLWNDEEDKMIALFQTLSSAERAKIDKPGKAQSAAPMGPGDGVAVSSLSQSAQQSVKEVLDSRIAFFAADIQKRVRAMIEKEGGIGAMRVAFWGTAEKRCAQGGKWDFKLAGDAFLCDYENTRGHIHMSMKGHL